MLSIAAPFGGNLWYGLTSISPFAGVYYLQKGNRQEEVSCPVDLHGELSVFQPAWRSSTQHYDLARQCLMRRKAGTRSRLISTGQMPAPDCKAG